MNEIHNLSLALDYEKKQSKDDLAVLYFTVESMFCHSFQIGNRGSKKVTEIEIKIYLRHEIKIQFKRQSFHWVIKMRLIEKRYMPHQSQNYLMKWYYGLTFKMESMSTLSIVFLKELWDWNK